MPSPGMRAYLRKEDLAAFHAGVGGADQHQLQRLTFGEIPQMAMASPC